MGTEVELGMISRAIFLLVPLKQTGRQQGRAEFSESKRKKKTWIQERFWKSRDDKTSQSPIYTFPQEGNEALFFKGNRKEWSALPFQIMDALDLDNPYVVRMMAERTPDDCQYLARTHNRSNSLVRARAEGLNVLWENMSCQTNRRAPCVKRSLLNDTSSCLFKVKSVLLWRTWPIRRDVIWFKG